MFIFCRLSENNANLEFKTGNKAFDEKNPDGTLLAYLKEDIASGGDFLKIYFSLLKNCIFFII